MISEKQAIKLLKKYASNNKAYKKVLAHSKAVQKNAIKIAKGIPNINMDFIKIASLLHDIGRFIYPPGKNSIKHGIAGSKILRKEGLNRCAKTAERHIGVGIRIQDIKRQKLKLPLKDYTPKTREEKIIAHADNLIFGSKVGTLKMVIERYKNEMGEGYVKRIKQLADEIKSWKR
jgi:uncharacterized protein (TIGR00295 family)|tara:strand:+ start:1902 stop:2426 length:525 start_codon:yes stop_codon:yes gene_type:complete